MPADPQAPRGAAHTPVVVLEEVQLAPLDPELQTAYATTITTKVSVHEALTVVSDTKVPPKAPLKPPARH